MGSAPGVRNSRPHRGFLSNRARDRISRETEIVRDYGISMIDYDPSGPRLYIITGTSAI